MWYDSPPRAASGSSPALGIAARPRVLCIMPGRRHKPPQTRRAKKNLQRVEREIREEDIAAQIAREAARTWRLELPPPLHDWPPLPITEDDQPGPLDYLRDALTLARRAGMPWHDAYPVACDTALAAAKGKKQRDEWLEVLHDTRTVWMHAYERRPTSIALSADALDTCSNDTGSALVLPLQA